MTSRQPVILLLGLAAWLAALPAAAVDAVPTHVRPTAVLERPAGGDEKQPVSWRALALTPNGKGVVGTGVLPGAGSSRSGAVMALWRAESGKLKAEKTAPAAGDVCLSPDGKIAVAGIDQTRAAPGGGGGRPGLPGFGGAMGAFGLNPGQHHFLHWPLADAAPLTMVLSSGKPEPGKPPQMGRDTVLGMQFLTTKKFALATGRGVFVWDYKPKKSVPAGKGFRGQDPTISLAASNAPIDPNQFDGQPNESLGISADGSTWIARLENGQLEAWDLRKGRSRFRLPLDRRAVVASLPADGSIFALASPRGAGQPAEIEVRAGDDGTVRVRLEGGPAGTAVSLAMSADGSVVACGGDEGEVVVWDVASGRPTDRISGLAGLVWPLALSKNGTVVATADSGGAQVWDLDRLRHPDALAGGAAPGNARGARADGGDRPEGGEHDGTLARGPLEVTLTIDGQAVPRTLLGLTADRLVTRAPGELRFQVDRAAAGKVTEIVAAEGGHAWRLDPVAKRFVGPTVEAPPFALAETAPPDLPADRLQTWLWLTWPRLRNRIADVTQDPINAPEIADLRDQAARLAAFLGERGLDARLAGLFAGLSDYGHTLEEEGAEQLRVMAEHEEARVAAIARREQLQAEMAPRQLLGFASMFIGAAPTTTRVTDTYGNTWHVETGTVSPELFEQGLTTMLDASMERARREGALRAAEGMADARLRERLEASVEKVAAASAALQEGYAALAGEPFAVADLPVVDAVDLKPRGKGGKGDPMGPILETLERKAGVERAALGQDNPFTRAEIEYVRALAGPAGSAQDLSARVAHLRQCAERVAALAGLVPADPAFDSDRAELLARAGTLALRAAQEQVGAQRLADAFNEHAGAARILFEQALGMAPGDAAGRWREQLAWALVLGGHAEEGVRMATEVAASRGRSPRFMAQLARAKCSIGMVDAGYADLEDAIVHLGFEDVAEARGAADFPRSDVRFRDLLELRVELRPFQPNQPTDEFHVVNRSRFALRDARVRITFKGSDVKGKKGNLDAEKTVEEWMPGAEVVVKAKADQRVLVARARGTSPQAQLSTPQPVAKVVVTAPRQGSGSDKRE